MGLMDAVIACTLRPTWSKAYYRLATARYELQHYEEAALAAFEGLRHDPTNKQLNQLLQNCVKVCRQVHKTTSEKSKTPAKGS